MSWGVDVIKIEKARVLQGWSKRQLSAKAHVDRETLNDLLTGRRRPHLGTVRAICNALGLAFEEAIVFE